MAESHSQPIQNHSNGIIQSLALFHDGAISSYTMEEEGLSLVIDCIYLAERIHPDYTHFQFRIIGVEEMRLKAWNIDASKPPIVHSELSDIFQSELEIMSAISSADGEQVLNCLMMDNPLGYTGGELFIHARDYRIMDEGGKEITPVDIKAIVKGYWEELKKG